MSWVCVGWGWGGLRHTRLGLGQLLLHMKQDVIWALEIKTFDILCQGKLARSIIVRSVPGTIYMYYPTSYMK